MAGGDFGIEKELSRLFLCGGVRRLKMPAESFISKKADDMRLRGNGVSGCD
jgi:hypothetical protein